MAGTTLDQSELPEQWVIGRPPHDPDELWWLVQAMWGYRIPRTAVCRGHVSPFEAFSNAYFANDPVQVWKASRGFGGKSNTLSLLVLTEAATLGCESNVLGGSAGQSLNVKSTSDKAWAHHHAPKGLLVDEPTQYHTRLVNGGHIKAQAASQTSVRGDHPQRLRLDEIDEMDLKILEAAQGQPMRKRCMGRMVETNTVMSSTHQYPDKTMTTILKRAKENGWPIYEWCWRETSNPVDGWLTKEEVERKRREISAHMWETEYDLQEPSFEGRAMDTDAVRAAFLPELGEIEATDMSIVVELPDKSKRYIHGIDWAKDKDWTIHAVFDVTEEPWVCVKWERTGRMPWPEMVYRAFDTWIAYGGILAHDATGIGNVVHDYMIEYLEDTFGSRSPDARKFEKLLKHEVMGGGRARHDFFSEYISGIENGGLVYPMIEWAYDEHRYATLDDLFGQGSKKGHPPDSVVAGAMAWKFRGTTMRPTGIPRVVERSSPWNL